LRTVSYSDLLGRFTSAIGVDSLLTAETTAFQRSLNDRIRQIWTRAKWPPLMTVVSKSVAAVDTSTVKAEKAVQIDNATDLFDVFSVHDKNPFTDNTAQEIQFTLVNGYIVLPKDASTSTIFVVGNQVPASDYGTGTTSIPQFMERMLLAYAISDYYRSDGQNDKALAEEQRAEEYYQQELERFERLESQNRIKINNYPNYYSNLLVHQTVI
jgi:hypothetical protein